jgi:hypothetical protein
VKLDSLRRHAAVPALLGAALAALVSCTASTHHGPAPSATVPPSAFALPASDKVAAGLARIRAAAKDNPPRDVWGHYRDEGGRIWYFWPLPDGRFCTGRELHLQEDAITQDVECTTDPLPHDGSRPVLDALDGPASVHGGRWVTFLYADQEEILDIACGDQQLTAERITRFPTPYGQRTLYAVRTPWAALGVLHARVRHPDGTTAPDQAQFAVPDRATHGSYEHVCP